jgi:hypothetical protein
MTLPPRGIILGESSLRRAIAEFVEHYHLERPHQRGVEMIFVIPSDRITR